MNKKENRGGKRKNAGRKKVADKKVPLTIYVEQSKILLAGGRDKARETAEAALVAV